MGTQIEGTQKTTPGFLRSWNHFCGRPARKEESEASLLFSLLQLQAALPPEFLCTAKFWRPFATLLWALTHSFITDWDVMRTGSCHRKTAFASHHATRQQRAPQEDHDNTGCCRRTGSPCTTWNFTDVQQFAWLGTRCLTRWMCLIAVSWIDTYQRYLTKVKMWERRRQT